MLKSSIDLTANKRPFVQSDSILQRSAKIHINNNQEMVTVVGIILNLEQRIGKQVRYEKRKIYQEADKLGATCVEVEELIRQKGLSDNHSSKLSLIREATRGTPKLMM